MGSLYSHFLVFVFPLYSLLFLPFHLPFSQSEDIQWLDCKTGSLNTYVLAHICNDLGQVIADLRQDYMYPHPFPLCPHL